jgi:hypothetical protein
MNMIIEMEATTLRQIAHAAILHYEFLKKQEGSLPPTEVATLKAARELENNAMNALWKEERKQRHG